MNRILEWSLKQTLPHQPSRGHLRFIFQMMAGSGFFRSLIYTTRYPAVFAVIRYLIRVSPRIILRVR